MALQTFVKINHVTNLTDARYCAGMMVDLLGFSLDPNESNFISPAQFKEISGWVSGVDFVGEFAYNANLDILEVLKEYPDIKWIEYNRLTELEELVNQGYSLIYKSELKEIMHLEPQVSDLISRLDMYLHIDAEENSLSASELESIMDLSKKCRVILGKGINSENVVSITEELHLFGISLDGGKEIKAGLRDFDQMADILEKLEIED